MTTGLIIIATAIVIAVGTALWYLYDEYKTYQDKYEWMRSQRDKARHELSRAQKEIQLMKKAQQSKAKQITMNVNVDTDEVVSKVMQGVNKKIEDIKNKEQVFIKVDGKEINSNKLKEIILKEENGNKNNFLK
ncbi:hypothetical protein KMD50_gp56 [Lactococcus phage PLgW-1]|uniref:Uncharacterized protein n=1 Tax=Lactococcus phage PLgW-1 TaxID=1983536 RepID=A0A2Z2GSX3_9CAUD|nr:hypothetical protein KMD50_gp56 [Lactococcus phage PLgW-1]ARQ94867.1 hypothetical protein PLgW1_56 [Lactococcus phage PLgW-1]